MGRKRAFPFEVEIYSCGGCRVDGVWYGPREVKRTAEKYLELAALYKKAFVFKKADEDVTKRTALRVSSYFMREEGR